MLRQFPPYNVPPEDMQTVPGSDVSMSMCPIPLEGNIIGYLEVTLVNGQKESVSISPNEEIYIGRHPDCKLVIPDVYCSIVHLKIYSLLFEQYMQPLVYCQDLSRNGTRFNGHRIGLKNSILLTDKDIIEIRKIATIVFRDVNLNKISAPDLPFLEADRYLFSDNYTVTNRLLGEGGFGKVLMAMENTTHKQVACKAMDLLSKKIRGPQSRGMLLKEVKILLKLSHPNIINLQRVYSNPYRIYIFEDLITGGDLWSLVDHEGRIEEAVALPIFWQLLQALGYLHDNGIVHRDLKPDNILLTSRWPGSRIILTDFGTAIQVFGMRMHTCVGTAEYTAPEIYERSNPYTDTGYSEKVDIWSFGNILYMTVYGHPPFAPNGSGPGENKKIQARALKCDLSSLDTDLILKDLSPEFKDLIRNTIHIDPKKRLGVEGLKQHTWFGRYKELLDIIYTKACAGWTRREQPAEWIDVVETKLGRVYKKIVGDDVSPYFPGPHDSKKEATLQQGLEMTTKTRANQGGNGIEETMSNVRINSIVNQVQDCSHHEAGQDGNIDGNDGDVDMLKNLSSATDQHHPNGDSVDVIRETPTQEAELHDIVSSEQKGWKSARAFAEKIEETRKAARGRGRGRGRPRGSSRARGKEKV